MINAIVSTNLIGPLDFTRLLTNLGNSDVGDNVGDSMMLKDLRC